MTEDKLIKHNYKIGIKMIKRFLPNWTLEYKSGSQGIKYDYWKKTITLGKEILSWDTISLSSFLQNGINYILTHEKLSEKNYNHKIGYEIFRYFLPNWTLEYESGLYGGHCDSYDKTITLDKKILNQNTEHFLDFLLHEIAHGLTHEELDEEKFSKEWEKIRKTKRKYDPGHYMKVFLKWCKYFRCSPRQFFRFYK